VSLKVEEGTFVSLLGPSGCGKSTLLNIIAGFVAKSKGTVKVDGREVSKPGADRGMVFQEYALFPWRTALENVEFGPQVTGAGAVERRQLANYYLEMVGLSQHAKKYPSELSGGMKQRVAIARALANNPSVLLMDEPFGALDAHTRETMQEELLRIWEKERKTVVFVTHSVDEAVFLSDRVVLMGTHPGHVREVFDIDLPHPRDRSSDEFVALEKRIHKLMREFRPAVDAA
jgi:NitT/TauT family transport system ATP-binding protein